MTDDLMENRRLQGRAAIARKLKFSQDFSMGQNLDPRTTVWTKWHQQRHVNQEMSRDMSQTQNQRYQDVSYSQNYQC